MGVWFFGHLFNETIGIDLRTSGSTVIGRYFEKFLEDRFELRNFFKKTTDGTVFFEKSSRTSGNLRVFRSFSRSTVLYETYGN